MLSSPPLQRHLLRSSTALVAFAGGPLVYAVAALVEAAVVAATTAAPVDVAPVVAVAAWAVRVAPPPRLAVGVVQAYSLSYQQER